MFSAWHVTLKCIDYFELQKNVLLIGFEKKKTELLIATGIKEKLEVDESLKLEVPSGEAELLS